MKTKTAIKKAPAPKLPKPVHARELSNLKMSCGNQKKCPVVIDDGIVKGWVGIGWVSKGKATAKDKALYPEVTRD